MVSIAKKKNFSLKKKTTLWPPSDFNHKEEDLSITKKNKNGGHMRGGGGFLWIFSSQSKWFFSCFKKKFIMETTRWPLHGFFFLCAGNDFFQFFLFCNQNHLLASKQFYQKNEIEYTWQPQFMVCLHCVYVAYVLHRNPLILSNVLFVA